MLGVFKKELSILTVYFLLKFGKRNSMKQSNLNVRLIDTYLRKSSF